MDLKITSEWLKAYIHQHGGVATISRRVVIVG
jgi:hypothetical protein